MTMFDEDYPSRPIPPDPRGQANHADFAVISSWENGEVRHVSGSGASTNGLPPFPNCQGDDCQGEG